MSMKLLPAAVNPDDPSPDVSKNVSNDLSTSLVPLTPGAITTRAGQLALVPSFDTFAWSSSTPRSDANRIDGTPVEDSQSDETASSAWEYISGWAWSPSIESTAVAQYLSYAAGLASWSGRLINLYA